MEGESEEKCSGATLEEEIRRERALYETTMFPKNGIEDVVYQ